MIVIVLVAVAVAAVVAVVAVVATVVIRCSWMRVLQHVVAQACLSCFHTRADWQDRLCEERSKRPQARYASTHSPLALVDRTQRRGEGEHSRHEQPHVLCQVS